LRQGRTLDALQSAYRVGARVAWRRLAEAGRRAGLDPEVLSLLAESIFAYIEELSADSVEGYAEARSRLEDERRRRHRELLTLLLRDPPAEEADVRAAAAQAGWRLPQTAAALACAEHEVDRVTRRLPPDALSARLDGVGCAVLPDPEGPGRGAEIDRALEAGPAAALGPAVPLPALGASWSLARATLHALDAGAIDPGALPVRADEALGELLLFESSGLVDYIAARRLGPLAELTPTARRRMEETALAYLEQRGNAAAMSRALGVHPQTARHRLKRLRELLGSALDDPGVRFELEVALRGQRHLSRRPDRRPLQSRHRRPPPPVR
jgi:PucR C-terminal helix-turn-helix domain